ncbi:hypothetical protein LTR05_004530 [Lithohypha guttulata]|uniref:Enoyl reductase (ER) domain-containing protein n=1 Tax=Lithohypha guttulata TaxID=1690604 RepID=A0AAN7SZE0_9EURO|nr:hypothetical protein LTR05_004530 [Lithohypha guttulata]
MRALVLDSTRCTAIVSDVPISDLATGEILVRVYAIALNPVDALYTFDPLASASPDSNPPRILGSDFAGVVERCGHSDRSNAHLKVGDRIAGFLQGASSVNHRPGAFAEYVAVPSDLVWRIPDSMTFEEAASVSLCGLTAAQALFGSNRLGLTAPWIKETDFRRSEGQIQPLRAARTLFVYGASTSVVYAAQLAHHAKEEIKLIGAASSRHFEWLQKQPYAYDLLTDYRSDWQAKISQITNVEGLDLAYDCISEGHNVESVSKLMKPDGKMAVVRSIQGGAWAQTAELPVEPSYGAVWEGLGEEVQYKGMNLPANPDARAFAVNFYQWLSESGDRLKPNVVRMMPGGLEKVVEDGFQLLGSGLMTDRKQDRNESWMQPVSAEKLVYRLV